jgi:hypothetical protein
MSYQRGVEAESLVANPEVQAALESMGYDQEKWTAVINEAKKGNDEKLKVMLDGLKELVGADYDKIAAEYEEMLASTAKSLTEFDSMSMSGEFDTKTQ